MSTRSMMGALGSASSWAWARGGRPSHVATTSTPIRDAIRFFMPMPAVLEPPRGSGGEGPSPLVLPVVESAVPHAHLDGPLRAAVAADEGLGEGVLDVPLDGAAQRACAVGAVGERLLEQPVHALVADGDDDALLLEVVVELVHEQPRDAVQVLVGEGVEDDDLVHAVD